MKRGLLSEIAIKRTDDYSHKKEVYEVQNCLLERSKPYPPDPWPCPTCKMSITLW